MSVLKTTGRSDIIAAYKALAEAPRNFLVGFGPGESWWGGQQQVLLTLDDDGAAFIPVDHTPVTGISVTSADGATPYDPGTDYTADVDTGRIARVVTGNIASGATVRVGYTATVPEPDLSTQTLVGEVGRIEVSSAQFVMPFEEAADPAASFVTVEGVKYALSASPTRMLLFQATLEADDGVGAPIREYALFSRCAVDPALPPGQSYFDAGDIVDPGVMIVAKNRSPVPHDGTIGLAMSIILEI